jgi:hypothetical protein
MFNFSSIGTDTKNNPTPALRRRKNLGLIHKLLTEMQTKGLLKPDDVIHTKDIEQVIKDSKLSENWNRSDNAGDDHGLVRSLSDLIGGHGLRLKKLSANKQYRMPKKLPTVRGDCVLTEAVY